MLPLDHHAPHMYMIIEFHNNDVLYSNAYYEKHSLSSPELCHSVEAGDRRRHFIHHRQLKVFLLQCYNLELVLHQSDSYHLNETLQCTTAGIEIRGGGGLGKKPLCNKRRQW